MTTEFRLLNIISKKINLNLFYNVSLGQREIRLQGHCKEQTLKTLRKLGYEPEITDSNWISMKKGCVNITLTLQ